MTASPNPRQNKLLAALPDAELLHLAPELDVVELHPGQALFESGSTISFAYFPTTALVSTVYEFEDGASAGTALVGNEGVVDIAVFMGGDSRLGRAVVLAAGQAFRVRALAMREEFHRAGPLMRLLLRYTQALLTQTAQAVACNRHHSLEQRLCRWLLSSLDRMQCSDFGMTQETIAHMLCVRREGVTAAAQHLQKLGLIRCTRAHIVVLDRHGLEQRACECYSVVRQEYERLLPGHAEPKECSSANAPRRTVLDDVFAVERTALRRPATVVEGEFG